MKRAVFAVLLFAAVVSTAGCVARHDYYGRRGHEMDDRDAWDIVRRDPCRYEEYRRFAEDHTNPEKRRRVVWQLARDGCSREQRYESQPRRPHDYDDYDR